MQPSLKHLRVLCWLVLFGLPITISAADIAPAIGYRTLSYDLPEVGSYQLPALKQAADGTVLDTNENPRQLHDLYRGKYTLLGFIYSNCGDLNGCPLSSYVFYKLKSQMQKDPELADNLQLMSLSFDPERDTPKVMQLYGKNFDYAGPNGEWHFLTTDSEASLKPLLKSYEQDVQREMSVNGKAGTAISHVLRVYLIDPENAIRNIYSVQFLHPDIIINDLKTLLQQDRLLNKQAPDSVESAPKPETETQVKLIQAANKTETATATATAGLAEQPIHQRQGKATDLLALTQSPPLGLPPLNRVQQKNLSADRIALGRKLFFDRRLSLNDTLSCAMCHVPDQGFTSNEIATAVGFEGRSVRRNTPSLYNVAHAKTLFHDAREDSLEQQVWGPFLATNEMANPSIGYVINKLRKFTDYQDLFETSFDGQGPNMQTVGLALAAYQRSLLSADSPFDRWYFAKQPPTQANFSKQAEAGFKLFTGKARCSTCHTIGADSALFSDHALHNTGLGYLNSMGQKPETQRVMLAPGIFVEVDSKIIDSVSETPIADLGHYEVSQDPDDRWKYKTPILRNVAITAPYMHNGSLPSLRSVVEFYNQGGIANSGLDPLITPLNLNDTEIDQLVVFLQSLTGSNVDTLVSDAFAAPIGDTVVTPAKQPTTKASEPKNQKANTVGGDFTLTDHHGKPFNLAQLRGKVALIFFGYTHCPDVCPTELARMAQLLKQLGEDADKVQGLFVSVDPERDTPEILNLYVPYFHSSLIGLTGSRKQIQTVTDAYHVQTKVQQNQRTDTHYFVDHTANLFIIDGQGKLAQIVPFGFPAQHILDAVQRTIATLNSNPLITTNQ